MSKIGNKMPLLTTLAALVIIVHSAEENFEPDYRDYRPRVLETANTNYEQTWRDTDAQQVQPDKSKAETWHDGLVNEPLRRRRPGRKRKRRPQLSSTEDIDPSEPFVYQVGSLSIQEEDNHNTELPKRRRKKINQESDLTRPTNWRDESIEIPHRRRKGQKRKRPVHSWTETSEHDYALHDQIKVNDETNNESDLHVSHNNEEITEPDRMEIQDDNKKYNEKKSKELTHQDPFKSHKLRNYISIATDHELDVTTERVEDTDKLNSNYFQKDKDARVSELPEQNKRLDPLILKTLLKRSNGKSLSEILLQNNLSLSDLLSGKEQAVSILKLEDSAQSQEQNNQNESSGKYIFDLEPNSSEEYLTKSNDTEINFEEMTIATVSEETTTESIHYKQTKNLTKGKEIEDRFNSNSNSNGEGISSNANMRRRFPTVRRKLRMRPVLSNSYKAQLSRDLIALSSMKYQNNRNSSRFRNFKELMTSKSDRTEPSIIDTTDVVTETTTFISDEIVTPFEEQINDLTSITLLKDNNVVSENDESETLNTADSKTPIIGQTDCENKETTTTLVFEIEPEYFYKTTTESTKEDYTIKTSSTMHQQSFDNRSKRKRMKQRVSTVSPENYEMRDVFDMANLVPASEFIAKTKTTEADDQTDFTTLEDFLTTEATYENRRRNKSRKRNFNRKIVVSPTQKPISTTEVTARIEIQEILKDTSTSERLSKILKERNMTLHELVEQRERGSSHIHLADIFHNASREPNPPEPFLSKSLIEPISKETYPLRALLEANQHDPKTTTIDYNTEQSNYLNKPIVMNFGNNVNENSENMGIISLFQNFTKNLISQEDKKRDMQNKTKEPLQISITNTSKSKESEVREGRALGADKELITWNEIINFMQNKEQNGSIEATTRIEYDNPSTEEISKFKTDKDSIEEKLGIFEDLQYLTNHLDSQVDPLSKVAENVNLFEENENINVLDTVDSGYISTTKSVTVATACIIGLSLVLFLLTYTILKWKQDAKILRNNSNQKANDIPTPIFENRKGLKINSSIRSKSPMLSTSNIYAIDSLDTHKGNDSPEYMWDTLRKPFQ